MQLNNLFSRGEKRNETRFRVPSSVIAVLLVVCSFGLGLVVGAARSVTQAQGIASIVFGNMTQPNADLTQLWLAWNTLNDRFVPTTATLTRATDQEKVWGMIKGLTESYGDPYTVFFPPEEAKAFQETVSGNFEGVGMEIGARDGGIVVVAPIADSPAERAGMRTGDKILAVDGKPTEGLSVDQTVKLIRGKGGTIVKLTIVRSGTTETTEVSITRAVINVPAIKTTVRDDGVFVVSFYSFSGLSTAQFRDAMRKFVQSGYSRMIIDLRGNPGGYLEAAVDTASYFLPVGYSVVSEDSGNSNPTVHHSRGYDIFARGRDVKVVVLIDEGSASASEILAGALRDHGKATIIGKKSFGKGSVQELVDLGGGASLKVTIAKWLTPDGISISEHGIVPDVEVNRTLDDVKAGKDPQMDKAVEYLRTR